MISGSKNILLIQLGDIGDVVLTTPTIRAVKETYPDSRVSILVLKPYGSLLAADPDIYEVIEAEKIRGSLYRRLKGYAAFARRLRQARYDMTIDLRTGDRGAILSFLTGAPVRVGRRGVRNQFWHAFLFTKTIPRPGIAPPPVHPGADQSLRVVREIGIDTADSTPRLHLGQTDRTRALGLLMTLGMQPGQFITINPFSRWMYKEWDNGKWVQVIDRLWEEYRLPAALIGSREEAAACQEIVAGREGRAFSLAGETTLGEMAAVISMSRLHLGVDSAAPHIAAALGTPTVTIHGPTDWRAWRVVNELHRIVSPAMDCLPCNKMGCDGSGKSLCLEELDAEPVILAALDVLGKRGNPA
jgi:heptosyltransferase-3